MKEWLLTLGIALIIIAFLCFILYFLFNINKTKTETKVAFIGFIGPIPIGFSNNKNLLIVLGLIAALTMLGAIVWLLLKRF